MNITCKVNGNLGKRVFGKKVVSAMCGKIGVGEESKCFAESGTCEHQQCDPKTKSNN